MKCTRNLHPVAANSYPLKRNTCSAVSLYISPQIRIYIEIFLCSSIKRKIQKYLVIFKGTAVSAVILHMPCVFYTAGSHVCLWIDRRSHVCFFNRIFFLLHWKCFYTLKMRLLINLLVNF